MLIERKCGVHTIKEPTKGGRGKNVRIVTRTMNSEEEIHFFYPLLVQKKLEL